MTNEIVVTSKQAEIIEVKAGKPNPVGAYLAGLAEGSRRGQLVALRVIIAVLSDRSTGEVVNEEVAAFTWHEMTGAHVDAIRSKLQESHSPAYANKCLAAVLGVLKAAWRLKLMTRDNYARAIDVMPVRGETLPAGRDLSPGEIAVISKLHVPYHRRFIESPPL